MKAMWRIFGGALVVLLVGSALTPDAEAYMIVEIRDAGGTEVGPVIPLDPMNPTGPIELQVWAVLTEANGGAGPGPDDKWGSTYVAAQSTDGGLVLADMSLVNTTAADDPANLYFLFLGGAAPEVSFDGDGDLDARGTDPEGPTYYRNFMFNSSNPTFGEALVPEEVWIGKLAVNVTGWGPDHSETGPSGATKIWLTGGADAVYPSTWTENGDAKEGIPEALGDVLLILTSTADAGSTVDAQEATPDVDLILDGSAATGSINWWRWEFDGDGLYTEGADTDIAVETGDPVTILTWDDLVALGLLEGDHDVTMTVGWVESPAENVSTSGFLGFTMIPEPATLALMGLGLALVARRKRK